MCVCNSLARHISAAAEHIQLYLDRSDRAVVGATYCSLHQLIDSLETSNILQAAVNTTTDTSDQSTIERQQEAATLLLSEDQQSECRSWFKVMLFRA